MRFMLLYHSIHFFWKADIDGILHTLKSTEYEPENKIILRYKKSMREFEQINRILIIRLAPLGETILTTPVIRALRHRFPDAYIAYMVAPQREELIAANPHLDEVLTYTSSVPRLIYQFVRRRFQMAVVLQPTFRLVLHTFLARIPFRVGFETNKEGRLRKMRLQAARYMLNLVVPNNTDQHEVQRYLDVVRWLGIDTVNDEPEVFVDSTAAAWADNFFEKLNLDAGRPLIGLNPGAATTYRRWPRNNFAILGDRLRKAYHAHIIITTGPQEGELAVQIADQMRFSPVIVNDTTPMQLAALLQRCHLYISNDTGPMHLSTAVKTPTIALFGASNPLQWGPPWGSHKIVTAKDCYFMRTLSPKEWDAHTEIARQNLEAITPDAVMATVEKLRWKSGTAIH